MSQREWLYLAVFTLIVVAALVTYEVYHIYISTTISEVDEELLVPITPEFDKETLIRLLEEN